MKHPDWSWMQWRAYHEGYVDGYRWGGIAAVVVAVAALIVFTIVHHWIGAI